MTLSEFFHEHWLGLLALGFLLALRGLLVSAEIAMLRVRFSHFNPDLIDYFERHPGLGRIMVDPDSMVRSLRFALTLCLFGYGALTLLLGRELVQIDWIVEWALPTELWLAAVMVGASAVFYLLADFIPRALGVNYPKAVLLFGRWPMVVTSALVRPALWPLSLAGDLCLRIFRIDRASALAPLELHAQMEQMGEHDEALPVAIQTILRNSLQLRDLVVSDVLLPRNQVQFMSLFDSPAENLKVARETGHTRFPLCEGDLDRCVGLIHVKDLFRIEGPLERVDLRRIKRRIIRVGGEEPLEQALSKLLAHNMHMALVIDEFRGVEGLLTLEKILEQLVGDIRDEFDADESSLIRETPSADKELMVDGLTPLHDLETHFGVDLSNSEVSTVSGLITLELGHIPVIGESIEVSGMRIEATQVDETRVLEALVSPVEPSSAADEEADDDKETKR
jgi:CBS domain containing-hemolysin-like protein